MNYLLGGFFPASNEENRSMTEEALIEYVSVSIVTTNIQNKQTLSHKGNQVSRQ
jgi:hypothetical protein